MTQEAAKTGAGPTVMVAVEQHFPEDKRIIEDDLAYGILPLGTRAFVWLMRFDMARGWMVRETEKSMPGLWSAMMCRKRHIDEKLEASQDKIEAVVNLGAGFDTRAYRLPALAETPVWEVDQPENIEPKRVRLRKLFGAVPVHARLVAMDFDREDLGAVLAEYGYEAERRTFFIWEAVTQYLTGSGIQATFDFLGRAARGSRLAFTYVRKAFLDGEEMYGAQELYEEYVVKDQTWIFGMEPEEVVGTLGEYGWGVVEHVGYEELAQRYVKVTGRDLASSPLERLVYAEKIEK